MTKFKEVLSSIPSLIWLFVFFFIPTCIIFIYSFKPSGLYGGIESGWTLETLKSLANPYFFILLARTLWISILTTLICLFLALPMGYQIATSKSRWRHLMLMMIVIPFWSSFLIRIFAWKTILHPEGFLHQFLEAIGILSPNTPLLYTNFAVIVVMIYTFLPFALLPIYTAASKFNFQLIEAAMDLGASRFKAITQVFVPAVKKGIAAAALMVFISAFGTYVIPDLVGGVNSDMIGNKIAQKIFAERNLPEASAISLVLCLIILIPLGFMGAYAKKSKSFLGQSRNKE